MQNEGKPWHFCIGVPDHTSSKPVGLIGREVPSLSKPNMWSQMTWSFYLRSKCSDTKEQPFRRMEITSQFLVSEVPVYAVLVFVGVFPEVFFSCFWPAGRISLPLLHKGWRSRLLYLWVSGDQAAAFFPKLPVSTLPGSSCLCCHTLLLQGPRNAGCSAVCCQLDPLIINFVDCASLTGLESGGFCEG